MPLPYITKQKKYNLNVSFSTFNGDWVGTLVSPVQQYKVENMLSDSVLLEEKNIIKYIHFDNKRFLLLKNKKILLLNKSEKKLQDQFLGNQSIIKTIAKLNGLLFYYYCKL